MKILSNSLRINFRDNPEDVIGLLVDGWRIREGIQGYCQTIRQDTSVVLSFSDVRCSAATLAKALKTLTSMLDCIQSKYAPKLVGEVVFGEHSEVWRVSASSWAHGNVVVEWDHIMCGVEEDEDSYEHET